MMSHIYVSEGFVRRAQELKDENIKLRTTLSTVHTWLICPDTSVSAITEIRNLVALALRDKQ